MNVLPHSARYPNGAISLLQVTAHLFQNFIIRLNVDGKCEDLVVPTANL
jgi:predicted phage tail protein